MPHKPLACSEEFYGKSKAGLYADVIMELDWSVGQIMARLRELDLDENTLVIFTSDNGPWYGGSSGGLRGMKSTNWEGGVRVPFIAHWPGHIPGGRSSDELGTMADVFATALAAAKIAQPADRVIDGRNLLPLLTGKSDKGPHQAIFTSKGETVCSVRSGPWKLYVRAPGTKIEKKWEPDEKYLDPRRPDGVKILAPYEQPHPSEYPGLLTGDPVKKMGLFNLKNDPGEQKNVIEAHPEVVRELQGMVRQFEQDLARSRQNEKSPP
jgi:uncharacterized sulfatase